MERLSDLLRKADIGTAATGESFAGNNEGDTDSRSAEPRDEPGTCPVCHGSGWVGQVLPVDDPEFGKPVPCQCRLVNLDQDRVDRLQRYSNLGPLADTTFERTIESGVRPEPGSRQMFAQALTASQTYAADPRGWLVLVGTSGSGKTHLAAAITNERLRQDEKALFIFIPDLLDHLRSAYAPNAEMAYDTLFHQVREAPFLVLDDLGAQASTPWAEEKLFQILNHRFTGRLPTVITLSSDLDAVEPRLRSRLSDPEISRVIALATEAKDSVFDGVLGLPRFQAMTFASFRSTRTDLTIEQGRSVDAGFRAARTFAEKPDGWLVFMGDHGVGKTHLAAAVANERVERGSKVLLVVVPDLLDHLRYTFQPGGDVTYDEAFEEVKRVPMLVMDDLGAHSTSPWAQEKLYQIINYRYNAQLPMIVTTDLSLDELERTEPRIASRLADTRFSVVLGIDATDFRIDRPPSTRYQRSSTSDW